MPGSGYLEGKVLDAVLGNQAFPSNATVYVALGSATSPAFTELTGTAYARVAVTNNLTQWPAASGGPQPESKSNANPVTFPTVGAGGWGTCTEFAIFDAASGGNMLLVAPLSSVTLTAGLTPSFAAGQLTATST